MIDKILLVVSAFGIILEVFFKVVLVVLTLYHLEVLVELSEVQKFLIALGGLYWVITTLIGFPLKSEQSNIKSKGKSK